MTFELNVNAVWQPHQTIGDAKRAWARAFVGGLEPYHAGTYLNFLDHDDLHRTPAAFRDDAHTRLAQLQRRFDPDGMFRHSRTVPTPLPAS